MEGLAEADFGDLFITIHQMDIQALPADQFFGLHELIDSRTDPGFAVRVGQQMTMEDYGVLGMAWRTCAWAGEIFDRCERYFKLLSNTYVFQVDKGDQRSRVLLHRDHYRPGVALSNEATLSAAVVVLQAMTETRISPVEVGFRHQPPADLTSHQEAFRCPVLFGQTDNYLTYQTKDLETRTAKADLAINHFLLERVKEETEGIEISANRVVLDVENLIKDALPGGIPSIHQVGNIMGMSNRTLTRRLAECGLSFRTLISKKQQEIAIRLLEASDRNIAEIAFETGFSDQSAFNRAFKRWTGRSPLEFRKGGQGSVN